MDSSKPFKHWLNAGVPKEEMKSYYAINDAQFQKVIDCLEDIAARKEGKI